MFTLNAFFSVLRFWLFRDEKHNISKNINSIELIFLHKMPKGIFQWMVQWIFDILKIRPVRIFNPRAVGTQNLIFCVFAHKTISIKNFKKIFRPSPADYQQETYVKNLENWLLRSQDIGRFILHSEKFSSFKKLRSTLTLRSRSSLNSPMFLQNISM